MSFVRRPVLDKALQLTRCAILEQIEGLPKHHLLPVPDIVGGVHHPVTIFLHFLTLHKQAAVLYLEYKLVTSLFSLENITAKGNHSVNPF